jgi:formate hydrogenlyase subunit 6/NADH:ubiquinone oxidoreductase subunit I
MKRKMPGRIANLALSNLLKKPATVKYPEGSWDLMKNYRGKLCFSPENCINCNLCMRDCPTGAITIINEGTKEERKMKAVLNVGRCIFCCQCVDSCPKKCISNSQEFDLSNSDKDNLSVQI